MVFSSIPFLFYFLPFLLLTYFLVPKRARGARNTVLLAASLIFYAWGEGVYVLILLGMTLINHILGRQVQKHRHKGLLALGIVLNLLPLGWYKYAGFVADTAGLEGWQGPQLLLGISFFTFQAISYLVDLHREKSIAPSGWTSTALYICAFPQLIAGPIVRYHTISAQIEDREETVDGFAEGIRFFILGLGQKVLLANTLGQTADLVFQQAPNDLSAAIAWLGLICFTLQIYFDFAGYSNMAIGLGRFFGFTYPKNFDFPYISRSVQEFWRRWHITLSTWFRDYLYIPLGGSRGGPLSTWRNLWIVFLLCGLWHGAAWTFILWGAWHGLFLVLERVLPGRGLAALPPPLRIVYTLLVVMLGWVLFRSDNLSQAVEYYAALAGLNEAPVLTSPEFFIGAGGLGVLALAVLCATPLPKIVLATFTGTDEKVARMAGYAGLLVILALCCVMLAGSAYNPFLYFRF